MLEGQQLASWTIQPSRSYSVKGCQWWKKMTCGFYISLIGESQCRFIGSGSRPYQLQPLSKNSFWSILIETHTQSQNIKWPTSPHKLGSITFSSHKVRSAQMEEAPLVSDSNKTREHKRAVSVSASSMHVAPSTTTVTCTSPSALMVWWGQFVPAHECSLLNFQECYHPVDIMWIVSDWP